MNKNTVLLFFLITVPASASEKFFPLPASTTHSYPFEKSFISSFLNSPLSDAACKGTCLAIKIVSLEALVFLSTLVTGGLVQDRYSFIKANNNPALAKKIAKNFLSQKTASRIEHTQNFDFKDISNFIIFSQIKPLRSLHSFMHPANPAEKPTTIETQSLLFLLFTGATTLSIVSKKYTTTVPLAAAGIYFSARTLANIKHLSRETLIEVQKLTKKT